MKHMTKKEAWDEKVRLAAIRNRRALEKVLGIKKEKKGSPFVQYARPSQR